jgi:hypothetical protein
MSNLSGNTAKHRRQNDEFPITRNIFQDFDALTNAITQCVFEFFEQRGVSNGWEWMTGFGPNQNCLSIARAT